MAGNRVCDKEEVGRGLREGGSESLEEAHDRGGDSGRVGGLREGARGIRGLGGRGSGWGADGAQRKSRVSLCLFPVSKRNPSHCRLHRRHRHHISAPLPSSCLRYRGHQGGSAAPPSRAPGHKHEAIYNVGAEGVSDATAGSAEWGRCPLTGGQEIPRHARSADCAASPVPAHPPPPSALTD